MTATLGCRQFGIPGITASLVDDRLKEQILVGPSGYIARNFVDGEDLELTISLTPEMGRFFIGILIDETTSEVSEMSPKDIGDGVNGYQRVVHFRTDRDRIVYPERQSGNIRLIGASPTGECVMWNVGLVSQNGSVYLVFQTMFSAQSYRKDDQIVLPACRAAKKWRNLETFLGEKLDQVAGMEVPSYETYAEEQEREPVDGQVLWYTLRQQMGCIYTPKGHARVHWSHIQTRRPDGLKYLVMGEVVKYHRVPPRRRPGGRDTEFQWEAVEVRVVSSSPN